MHIILKGLLHLDYQMRQPFCHHRHGGHLYTDVWAAVSHFYRQIHYFGWGADYPRECGAFKTPGARKTEKNLGAFAAKSNPASNKAKKSKIDCGLFEVFLWLSCMVNMPQNIGQAIAANSYLWCFVELSRCPRNFFLIECPKSGTAHVIYNEGNFKDITDRFYWRKP